MITRHMINEINDVILMGNMVDCAMCQCGYHCNFSEITKLFAWVRAQAQCESSSLF